MAKDFNNLKNWIEKMCKEAGNLPIYKLANRVGIARAAIYNWMSDKNRPDSETMLRVAQALAKETGRDAAEIYAEGLSQYTPRQEGRPTGHKVPLKEVRARS